MATTNKERAKRNAVAQAKKTGGLKDSWKGVRMELSKVVWPTKQEMISYTGVVLAACGFFALALWAIDTGVLAALKAVLGVTVN
ncbi:MAG: preprotein translocase subunit SecE [Anaerovoracaceae bacterium]|nr:preprotein translocase subunit SecE [Anaerovoracaceae bacterium]SFE30295.1 preprotein translocase subunit SecE [Peptostreptococcaceae bacterium pGA-8]